MEPLNSDSDIKYRLPPIPLEKNLKINNQAEKCIFKIENENNKGTAFICQIPYNNKKILVLITSSNLINESLIKNNKCIKVTINDFEEKEIKINKDKEIFKNENQDISIIEIEPDSDLTFLELDESIFNEESQINNENIYIIHYICYDNFQKVSVSYGILNDISNNNMNCFCHTGEGSLGSPILRLFSNKVIGINTKNNSDFKKNNGYFLKDVIKEYILDYKEINIGPENGENNNLEALKSINKPTAYGPETHEIESGEDRNTYLGPETEEEEKNLKISSIYLGPETKEISQVNNNNLSNSNDIKPLNMNEIESTYSLLNSDSNNSNNNNKISDFNYSLNNNNNIINLELTLSDKNCFFVNNNNNNNIIKDSNNNINNNLDNDKNDDDFENEFNSLTKIQLKNSLNFKIAKNKNKIKDFPFSRYAKGPKVIIKNLGNASYLSSVLQFLGNIDSLFTFFFNSKNNYMNSQTFDLKFIFQNLYNILYPYPEKETIEVYEPIFILNQFRNYNFIYSNTEEQNPNNLILCILNQLHKELLIDKKIEGNLNLNIYDKNSVILYNISKHEHSKIVDIFNWFEIREFTCNCNHTMYYFYSYKCFQLDILGCYYQNKNKKNHITIEDCIKYQTCGRQSDNRCNKCKMNFYTQSKIYSTAEKIIFLLDRNNFSQNLLNIHFIVEDRLDLSNYIEYANSPKKYELTGIVSIPINQKAYVTFFKSPIDDEWYYYSNNEGNIIHKEINDVIKENNSNFIPSILIYNSIK